jgi:hypothetical protein
MADRPTRINDKPWGYELIWHIPSLCRQVLHINKENLGYQLRIKVRFGCSSVQLDIEKDGRQQKLLLARAEVCVSLMKRRMIAIRIAMF